MSNKWFAVYTKPRWEKKVEKLLASKGVEIYCPLNKVRRKWSDRYKLVEEPLFKSYVFVRISNEERNTVRMTDGVINFVYWDGKPAVIKDGEIQAIKSFLDEHENVELIKLELKPQDKVKVISGPLINQEGRVIDVRRKTARVVIDSMGYMLVAYIDKEKLIKNNL